MQMGIILIIIASIFTLICKLHQDIRIQLSKPMTREVPLIFQRSTVFYGTENGRLLRDELTVSKPKPSTNNYNIFGSIIVTNEKKQSPSPPLVMMPGNGQSMQMIRMEQPVFHYEE